jgi:hypothetical protein
MVTVLRGQGFRVVIYPNDHRPAHVHVIKAGNEALFNLHCPEGPPELWENYGFSRQDVQRIKALLADKVQDLCERWRAIHGTA